VERAYADVDHAPAQRRPVIPGDDDALCVLRKRLLVEW
jgi:hypothetical protein